ncbi:hypothetical protein PsYK624_022540 [Phanerochaete sordida]|uniref:Uncharacterized protein n=1 Tax=Phanerochaete sordida TaxID=48140 RepID=A0A9P3G1J3_9APHY|nr:hypothetical protein PsYK624_022540 [Phanerochaete sordida]
MAPQRDDSWRDGRAPPRRTRATTTLAAAERAYIWRMHLHTPRARRGALHAQLAVRYNCALRVVTECVAARGGGSSPESVPSQSTRGTGKSEGNGKGKSRARVPRAIAGSGVAVAEDVQGREVELAEAAATPEAGPSKPRAARRHTSAVYIEVSTVREVRAAYRASSSGAGSGPRSAGEATSSGSGGDSGGPLRRSPRTRARAGGAPASPFLQPRGAAEATTGSSHCDPFSVAPATTSSDEAGSVPAREECGGFRVFLEALGLDRTVPIFAEYGFRTAGDARLLREMTVETRKQLFEWLVGDGKVNLKELTVLHEHLIA